MADRIETFVESMMIRPTDRVLEIGCGHGVAATLICASLSAGSYLAVDRSRKMVEAAARRNRAFVDAGIARFMQSTLESLDLGEQRFDKVLAMRVRLFHDQPEQAEQLARRWLAPSGKLFVQYDEPERR